MNILLNFLKLLAKNLKCYFLFLLFINFRIEKSIPPNVRDKMVQFGICQKNLKKE